MHSTSKLNTNSTSATIALLRTRLSICQSLDMGGSYRDLKIVLISITQDMHTADNHKHTTEASVEIADVTDQLAWALTVSMKELVVRPVTRTLDRLTPSQLMAASEAPRTHFTL